MLQFKIKRRQALGQRVSSAPAALPGSAPVLQRASAGDKRRVGVLMMLQAQLSYMPA